MTSCVVGIPKEVKYHEGRVGMTPKGVSALTRIGATVCVEYGAGSQSGFCDWDYVQAGAILLPQASDVWEKSDIVVKVKEPIPSEYEHLSRMSGKTLFTYLHLAGSPIELTRELLRNKITAIAYETVSVLENDKMVFPLLSPMSKIAGTQAMAGAIAHHSSVDPSDLSALIIGGGNVGEAALQKAIAEKVGLIVLYDAWEPCVQVLREKYKAFDNVEIFPLSLFNESFSKVFRETADIVVSGPMLPGGKEAPIVLTQKHFRAMKNGCYISDVSIDQGGSTVWTKGNPTKPGETFTRGAHSLVFSAVPNIPGSTVPKEATIALTVATLPYAIEIVRHLLSEPTSGDFSVLRHHADLRMGLQVFRGFLTNEHVALHHKLMDVYKPFSDMLCT